MRFLFLCVVAALCGTSFGGDQIVDHGGVKCYRRLIPIEGSSHYRVHYDPVVVREESVVREEYKAPYAPPSEQELLSLPDGEYEKRLLDIIDKAAKAQSRRADIKLLRTLGLQIGEPDTGVYSKSVYSRGYESRPAENNFGISVRESVDFIGSDPTDVIASQIGRNVDGIRELFGDLNNAQAEALRDLIQSRAVNTERVARAIEEAAKGQADATRIRALSEATKRSHVDRETTVTGSLLQQLTEKIGGNAISESNGSGVREVVSQKCGKCHDPSSESYKEGRMDLSRYESLTFEQLASVVKRVQAGTMPPEGSPALTDEERKVIVDDFVNASTSSSD